MNKLEVGMYCKTKDGIITKVDDIDDETIYFDKDIYRFYGDGIDFLEKNNLERIIKASFNIIDLIEEGDILLLFDKEYGKEYKAEVVVDSENFTVVVNYEQNDLLILEYELITNEHIELLKILTKEQFESMSYRIGDDK